MENDSHDSFFDRRERDEEDCNADVKTYITYLYLFYSASLYRLFGFAKEKQKERGKRKEKRS